MQPSQSASSETRSSLRACLRPKWRILSSVLPLKPWRNGRAKRLTDVLWSEWFGKRQDVAQRLVAEGVLEESGGGFRLFSRNQFPTRDGMPELQLRGRLEQILRGQAQPTEQDATLIMLLDIYDAIRPLLKEELRGMGRTERKQAIENASASVTSPEIAQTLKAAKKSVEMAAVGATMTVFTP